MSKIIAIANQKGGVGKTTTAINFSAALAELGKACLLVDMDPQSNSTTGLGIDKNTPHNIYNVLLNGMDIGQIIKTTADDWLDIAPSSNDLAGAEAELVNLPDRYTKLKSSLEKISNVYEYIIIDCPPSLGFLTLNSLIAANSVLVTVQGEYFSLEGLGQLSDTINRLIDQNGLELEGVLFTMINSQTILARQVADNVKKHFGDKVYSTIIPRMVKLAEAPSFGKSIFSYDPNGKAKQCYLELAYEFLERQNGRG
ncbi:MAG: ParA family protein [Elusimicrobiota bacterium]|jgi:chromosome partitioning protein|nr:ParA family protein [Elusimicrobiota bacterium]